MESVVGPVAKAGAGPAGAVSEEKEEVEPMEGDSVLLQIRCRFVQRLPRCTYIADCPFTFPSPK